MKTLPQYLAVIVLFTLVSASVSPARAQGTAFTYQGRLNSGGGLASGSYDLAFTVYDTNAPGGILIAGPITNSPVAVSNGLFTVKLDFGAGVFTGPDRWLEIAVRTNGNGTFTTLAPRQALAPTPYAILANSASNLLGTLPTSKLTGALPAASLAGTYNGLVTLNNGANTFDGTFYGQFYGSSFTGGFFTGQFLGDGSGLFNLNASQLASGTVPDARLGANVVRTNQVWLSSGNAGTVAGTNFLGTTDNQPLEIKVNAGRALRLEPTVDAPNLIGGASNNYVASGVQGATIGGGGSITLYPAAHPNRVESFHGTVGGGLGNWIQTNSPEGTIAGGNQNTIKAGAFRDSIGGGIFNEVAGSSSVIGGGAVNTNWGVAAVLGGGELNSIDGYSDHAVIAGGGFNKIVGSVGQVYSTISGGYQNQSLSNAVFTFIGGGSGNIIQTNNNASLIVGGLQNTVQSNNAFAAIGGGVFNYIDVNAFESVIAGGNRNTNGAGSYRSFIGGGIYNAILDGAYQSVIGGGYQNLIQALAFESVIGGGYQNMIQSNNLISTIGGGQNNVIGTNATASVISGGYGNKIGFSVNQPYNLFGATIAGGWINHLGELSAQAVISGGNNNTIGTNSPGTVIGGGSLNLIQGNSPGSVISGGFANTNAGLNSVIGGGVNNLIQPNAQSATVPGGYKNTAGGSFSFAAGSNAQATNDGTFVWADSSSTNAFGSTTTNQFLVRATGGVQFLTAGGGVTVDGQPLFAGNNGSGLANVNAATLNGFASSSFAPAAGATTYIQNQNGGPQTASFNITGAATAGSLTVGNAQVTGLLRLGSETGTAQAPIPAGLVIRRINSTAPTSNSVVALARTQSNGTNLTFIRDGTVAGFQLQYPASPGFITIACMGIDNTGAAKNFYTTLANPVTAGVVQVYTNTQNVVHFECTFGITYTGSEHLTQVTLSRYGGDNYWSGTVISTFNQ